MKEYEIHASVSYKPDGVGKEWDCITEYVNANNPTEARRLLRAQLKSRGYIDIKFSDTLAVE